VIQDGAMGEQNAALLARVSSRRSRTRTEGGGASLHALPGTTSPPCPASRARDTLESVNVPDRMRWIFWDVDFDAIDIEAHAHGEDVDTVQKRGIA
jgi:hypothetical protein